MTFHRGTRISGRWKDSQLWTHQEIDHLQSRNWSSRRVHLSCGDSLGRDSSATAIARPPEPCLRSCADSRCKKSVTAITCAYLNGYIVEKGLLLAAAPFLPLSWDEINQRVCMLNGAAVNSLGDSRTINPWPRREQTAADPGQI